MAFDPESAVLVAPDAPAKSATFDPNEAEPVAASDHGGAGGNWSRPDFIPQDRPRDNPGGMVVHPDLSKPLVELPTIDKDSPTGTMLSVQHPVEMGIYNAAAPIVSSFTSPANIALLVGTGGLANAARLGSVAAKNALVGIGAYFSADMAKDAIKQAQEAKDKITPTSTTSEDVESVAKPVLTGAMSVLAALGAVHELNPKLTETLKTLPPKEGAEFLRSEAEKVPADQKPVIEKAATELENAKEAAPNFDAATAEPVALTAIEQQGINVNGKSRSDKNIVQAGEQANPRINTETDTNTETTISGGLTKAVGDWLEGVSGNDIEKVNNAEKELSRSEVGSKKLKELKLLVGINDGGEKVRASGDYGSDIRAAASEERARSSQELQHFGQQAGQLGNNESSGAHETSHAATSPKVASDIAKNDYEEYQQIQAEWKSELDKGGFDMSSPKMQELWRRNEEIKNRYDGMPPPKPEEIPAAEPTKFNPAEAEPVNKEPGFVTGVKNAVVDQERVARGHEPIMSQIRLSNAQAWDNGMKRVEADPGLPDRLMDEMIATPRPLDPIETSVLIQEKITRRNTFEAAVEKLAEARDRGDQAQVNAARLRVRDAEAKLNKIDEVSRREGSMAGASLQARKILAADDYSFASLAAEKMAAKGGEPLTESELLEVKKTADQLKEKSDQLDAQQKKWSEAPTTDLESPQAKTLVARILDVLDRQAAEAEKRLFNGRLNTISPQVLYDLSVIAARDIAHGAVDFTKWSAEKLEKFGERVRPHLEEAWKRGSKILDEQLEKTGGKKKQPSKTVANKETEELLDAIQKRKTYLERRIDKLSEKIKSGDLSPEDRKVGRPSIPEIEEFEQQRDALNSELSQMREHAAKVKELEETIVEKQRKLVEHDLATDGQKLSRPSVNEIEQLKQKRDQLNGLLAKARRDADKPDEVERIQKEVEAIRKQISKKEEALRTGDIHPKSGASNRPHVGPIEEAKQELELLNKQLAKARKEATKPSEQERVQKEVSAINKRIEQKKEMLRSGKSEAPKRALDRPQVREIEEAKQELEQVNRDLAEARKGPPKDKSLAKLQSYKTRLQNQIRTLQERIESGNFAKLPRKPLELDPEAMKLREQRETLLQQFKEGVQRDKEENLSKAEKATNALVKWRRIVVLSSVRVFPKLIEAGLLRVLVNPVSRLLGQPLRLVPGLAEKAPYELGLSAKSEAANIAGIITSPPKMLQKLLTGKTDIDLKDGQKPRAQEMLSFVGNAHGAIKEPVRQGAFAQSVALRLQELDKAGVDIREPDVQAMVISAAVADANRQIFMQDNMVTKYLVRLPLRALENQGSVGKALANTMKFLMPIVNVPTNIALHQMRLIPPVGFSEAAIRLVKAAERGDLKDGAAKLSEEDARSISIAFKAGMAGTVLAAYAWLHPENFGGTYDQKVKNNKLAPGDISIFGHVLPHWMNHAPELSFLNVVASARRVYDRYYKKEPGDTTAELLAFATFAPVKDLPFVSEWLRLFGSHKSAGSTAGELLRDSTIPSAVTSTLDMLDDKKRKPKTFSDQLKLAVPGLREEVKGVKKK